MRRLISFCFLFAWFTTSAGEITVTTWNLKWFPSGSPTAAPADVEAEHIRTAAGVLKEINPDVILLQEVRDFATCYRLAKEIGDQHVVVCSRFTEFGGVVGWQQVAILSKHEAVAAWSEDWKTTGTVDPPRGFAFAHFQIGSNDLAVYSLHLKSNLTRSSDEREVQNNILKRELAAEQVIRHIGDMEHALSNRFSGVIIGGDFNTSKEQFPSESTLETLEDAGFSSGFERLPLAERVTHPGRGRYPDATFDYVFAKALKKTVPPVVLHSPVSDHNPVTRKLVIH